MPSKVSFAGECGDGQFFLCVSRGFQGRNSGGKVEENKGLGSVMAILALVSFPISVDKRGVNYLLPITVIAFCGLSCTPIHEHRSGGGAYDNSALGPVLDANGPVPSERVTGARSFQEWRELE